MLLALAPLILRKATSLRRTFVSADMDDVTLSITSSMQTIPPTWNPKDVKRYSSSVYLGIGLIFISSMDDGFASFQASRNLTKKLV